MDVDDSRELITNPAAADTAMARALADVSTLDGRRVGRLYRARRHTRPMRLVAVLAAAAIVGGLITGALMSLALFGVVMLP